jgi:hypothetical protein
MFTLLLVLTLAYAAPLTLAYAIQSPIALAGVANLTSKKRDQGIKKTYFLS